MCLTIKLYKDDSFLEVNNSRRTEKKGRTMSANPSSTKAAPRKKARTEARNLEKKESESSGKLARMTDFKKSDFPAPTRTESAAAVEPEPEMEADEPAVPGGTGAATVRTGGIRSPLSDVARVGNVPVPEVVGPPISQQIAVLTVQVQPQKFARDTYYPGKDPMKSPELWRCPPHTPVFTSRALMTIKVTDGVPRVMSYVTENLRPGRLDDFIFVGVSLEDGVMDTADQIRHHKNNGKGRFTVASSRCSKYFGTDRCCPVLTPLLPLFGVFYRPPMVL